MQAEQSLQDREEAAQQQQEVLLLAFKRFRDLLADAVKASMELEASGTMNGTTDDGAGMCARMLCAHSLSKSKCALTSFWCWVCLLIFYYVLLYAGHSKQSATEAWHQFTELSLIAFTRHYFKAIATIAEKVETEIFGEDASLKESTLKAVIDCLHV